MEKPDKAALALSGRAVLRAVSLTFAQAVSEVQLLAWLAL